jgi:HAD superfamily hydrolase (TIGR01450 family)
LILELDLFKNKKAIVFDLDGTIYLGNELIDGAQEVISLLKKTYKIFFLTNNSSSTRRQVYNKLIKLGIETQYEHVYNSQHATIVYLKEAGIKRIFCIGSKDFRDELQNNNFQLGNENVEAVVVGLDFSINYSTFEIALDCIINGARLIVANRDANFPVEKGKLKPGSGAIVGAIEACSETKADFIAGKPSPYILNIICKDHSLKPDDIVLVGDSYSSDIITAQNFNCDSILIMANRILHEEMFSISEIRELLSLFIL